jgi:hypothetical protein
MNLLQLAQRLHRETGRSGVGPASVTGAIKEHQRLFDWIGDAWRELQTRPIDWRWMRKRKDSPTIANQMKYTATDLGVADFWALRQESYDYKLKAYVTAEPVHTWDVAFMPLDDFRRHYMDQVQPAGRPLAWSEDDDGALLIGPKPDGATYTIRFEYKQEPSELTDDADVPEFAPRHHMMLVWRALIEAGKFDNAPDVLARAAANYGRDEASLMSEYARPITLGGPLA